MCQSLLSSSYSGSVWLVSYCLIVCVVVFQLFHPFVVLLVVIGYHYLVVVQSFYTKFTPMFGWSYCLLCCVCIVCLVYSCHPYKFHSMCLTLFVLLVYIILIVFGWHLICISVLLCVVLCFSHSNHMNQIISHKFHLICSYSTQNSTKCVHHFCLIFCYFISICSNLIRVSPPSCVQFNYLISYSPILPCDLDDVSVAKHLSGFYTFHRAVPKLLFDCNANF